MPASLLNIIQVIVSLFLIVVILLQRRGAGLSTAFGGSGGGFYTRRGFERTLFIASIVLGILFLLLALLQLLV